MCSLAGRVWCSLAGTLGHIDGCGVSGRVKYKGASWAQLAKQEVEEDAGFGVLSLLGPSYL